MSIRAMNWAWGQKMAPTPKLILMAIADSANDLDECWPGVPLIAAKCCVSERTVQRVFQQLEASGLMTVTPRYTAGGRQTSNGYLLSVSKFASPDKLSPLLKAVRREGDKLSGTGVTSSVTVAGDTAMSPLEPPQESKQQQLQLHYPTQLSPAEKDAISFLLSATSQSDAQALLDELADSLECKTIKTSPLRWFRALVTRQKNGVFVPVGGIRIAERRNRQRGEALAKQATGLPRPTDRNVALNALAHAKKLISVRDSSGN